MLQFSAQTPEFVGVSSKMTKGNQLALPRDSLLGLASNIATVFRKGQSLDPSHRLLTFTGTNPNHAGPCLADLEANFDLLYEVLNVWRTSPPHLQETAMCLRIANQKCEGAIFCVEGSNDSDNDMLALKLASRIKTLAQYVRGLRRKDKGSKRRKIAILKSLIKISQYVWSTQRILHATRADVFFRVT